MFQRQITPLKKWKFKKLFDIQEKEVLEETNIEHYENIVVPHTWYKDNDYYRGCAVYYKKISYSIQENEESYLEFQAADQWCRVYVNRRFAGEHKGGYSAFRIPVNKEYIVGDELEIHVFVDNGNRGEISPLFGDFTVYGGLYRGISLITVPNNHFDLMYYGTKGILISTEKNDDNTWSVIVEPKTVVKDEKESFTILYEVQNQEGQVVGSCVGKIDETAEILVNNPILWNGKENPYLYYVTASLCQDNKLWDRVELSCGFRTIEINAEHGFYLNGKQLKLNGVAKHQDYAGCFCATSENEQEKDMELIGEIGANAIRLSHYQHPQYTYDLCDKKGYVVWAEIPMLKMTENEQLIENAKEQLKELILQNMHHPSICFWGIQNEIGMFKDVAYMHKYCRELNEIVNELDSSRISTCANLNTVEQTSELNNITDMVGYNLYFGWYYGEMQDYDVYLDEFHKNMPHVCLGISEYGVDCNLQFHTDKPKVKDYSEEFQALFHETVYPILRSKEHLWGSFVWNMFDFGSAIRDEGGVQYRNSKGLVTFDRKIKKDAFYYYKAQWSKEPFIHIAEKRFEKRQDSITRIKIYSNMECIDLYVNEEKVEALTQTNKGVFLSNQIQLREGENKIRAVSGVYEDATKICYDGLEHSEYIFKTEDSKEHVTNWFLGLEEEVNENYYSIYNSINELVESEDAMGVIERYMPEEVPRMKEDGGSISLAKVLGYMHKKYKHLDLRAFNLELNQIKRK